MRHFGLGEWIACPNAPVRDEGVLHFRKRIVLAERPEHLLVEVSADNQFLLYVNGQRVGSGPARGDLGHWVLVCEKNIVGVREFW